MTTFQIHAPDTLQQSWEFELAPSGIVVGVDGSPESIAAYNTAAAIARARRCALHVVSVISAFPIYHINPGAVDSFSSVDELRIQLRHSSLETIMRAGNADPMWTREVEIGRPAKLIVSIAEQRGADLIVVGRRAHGLMDRIADAETTLQVMRLSGVPVLAVATDYEIGRNIIVATDFSSACAKATKAAIDLMGKSGTVYLVHVEAPVELLLKGYAIVGENQFAGDIAGAFRNFVEELNAPSGVIVETVVLNGNPVPAIIEFAERIDAGMIVAGSHSHSRMERFFLGSVSTGLVRRAQCPVLVAPAGA